MAFLDISGQRSKNDINRNWLAGALSQINDRQALPSFIIQTAYSKF